MPAAEVTQLETSETPSGDGVVEVEAHGYRELRVAESIDVDGSRIALRDPATGDLFVVRRADVEAA